MTDSNNGAMKDYLPIVTDSMCLAVETARLVEKINRNFKFTIGEPAMKSVMSAGIHIKRACGKYVPVRKKVAELNAAQTDLDALLFGVEVALCANQISAEEKAIFDIVYDKVSGQLTGFLSSQIHNLQQSGNARQSPGGNAPGEISE